LTATPATPPDGAGLRATRATLPLTLLMQAAASAATIAPAVAAPALLARLGVGPVAVGLYVAAVYLAAMLSSQFGATLVRRWGPIRTSQVALALCAAGVALVGVPHLGAALAGALLLGAGYGPITPASSEILARTTPPDRYAMVFSIKQTGVPVGGVVAGLAVPALTEGASAAWAMVAIGALCALAAAAGAWLRTALDALRDPGAPMPRLLRLFEPVRFVAAHPVLFTLATCSFVFSAVQVCVTSYSVTFLTHDLRWTLVAAGSALAVAQIAGVVGRIAWGALADRHGDARPVLLALAGAMALCGVVAAAFDAASPHLGVIALLAVYGATAIGWNGVFLATIARVVPIGQAAQATSGSLFFTYFGVVIGPPLFGLIASWRGGLGPAFALLALPLAGSIGLLWRWRSAAPPTAPGDRGGPAT
jgi:MFS family permease